MFKVTWESNLTEFKHEIEDGVNRAMEAIGKDVMERAKEYCPVDTGRLRDSITYETGDMSVAVGSDVEYAAYVELGTSKMAAQPYLRPALEESGKDIAEELERAF